MKASVGEINALLNKSAVAITKLQITYLAHECTRAEFEVTPALHQPAGILNGGFSLLVAETVASIGSNVAVPEGSHSVGIEISASHLESVVSGIVTVEAIPLRIGKRLHVWEVTMYRSDKKKCCTARCSFLVSNKSSEK
jgi:1,4-dihydroxy-2-naphthoyl-CoA hydrolase